MTRAVGSVIPMIGVLGREAEGTEKRGRPRTDRARVAVIQLQVQECIEPPGAVGGEGGFFHRAFRVDMVLLTF